MQSNFGERLRRTAAELRPFCIVATGDRDFGADRIKLLVGDHLERFYKRSHINKVSTPSFLSTFIHSSFYFIN